jgi:hypothetical protein
LPNRFTINSARDVLSGVAAEQRRNATSKLHHLNSAPDIPTRFGQRLAVLARVAAHNLFEIFLEQHFETKKYTRALDRRRFPPSRKCRCCRLHCIVHMRRSAHWRECDHFAC